MTTNTTSTLPPTKKVLAVLRASADPQTVAGISRAIGQKYGVRYARPTISGALGRLAAQGLVSYFDDGPQCNPRQWFAIPEDLM